MSFIAYINTREYPMKSRFKSDDGVIHECHTLNELTEVAFGRKLTDDEFLRCRVCISKKESRDYFISSDITLA